MPGYPLTLFNFKSMTEMKIFKNPLFGEVRTLKLPDGQVGFVGKDVATALGYKDSKRAVYDHVDVDDKNHRVDSTPWF